MRGASKTVDRRRQRRLDALYAELADDPHALGEAYQIVGDCVSRSVAPDGTRTDKPRAVLLPLLTVMITFPLLWLLGSYGYTTDPVVDGTTTTGTVVAAVEKETGSSSTSGRGDSWDLPEMANVVCTPTVEYYAGDSRHTVESKISFAAVCAEQVGTQMEVAYPQSDPAAGKVMNEHGSPGVIFVLGFLPAIYLLLGVVTLLSGTLGRAMSAAGRHIRGKRMTNKGRRLTTDSYPRESRDVRALVQAAWTDPKFTLLFAERDRLAAESKATGKKVVKAGALRYL